MNEFDRGFNAGLDAAIAISIDKKDDIEAGLEILKCSLIAGTQIERVMSEAIEGAAQGHRDVIKQVEALRKKNGLSQEVLEVYGEIADYINTHTTKLVSKEEICDGILKLRKEREAKNGR